MCEQGLSVLGGQAVPCSPLLMYVLSVTCASRACQCWVDRPCSALHVCAVSDVRAGPISAGWTGRALLFMYVLADVRARPVSTGWTGRALLLVFVLSMTCEQSLSVLVGQAVPCSPLLMYVLSVTCASRACQCWVDRPCPAPHVCAVSDV
ncbi:hypothetical protein NDU88_007209 [Pleurodeles waltl]|uniref:Uncharacterized protein n=1 Tax=Pleurodeles waltl TaxID=8319 RepID=A0AAV7MPL7_PLEWA|nr:hypothetical protein NDU88_007209 [Pleurodeles waltl]